MKSFRILSAIFLVFGIFIILMGILSAVIPSIQNDQIQMILSSMQETSADSLTNTLNAIVRFCTKSAYFLLFCGVSFIVIGVLMNASMKKNTLDPVQTDGKNKVTDTTTVFKPIGAPKPVYYPGGMPPEAYEEPFPPLPDVSYTKQATEEKLLSYSKPLVPTPTPIVGGVEPSFLSNEDESYQLMENDMRITAQRKSESNQYSSNVEMKKEEHTADTEIFWDDVEDLFSENVVPQVKKEETVESDVQETGEYFNYEPNNSDIQNFNSAENEDKDEHLVEHSKPKPRIVSTMGMKKNK